jgi:hypothetical protein
LRQGIITNLKASLIGQQNIFWVESVRNESRGGSTYVGAQKIAKTWGGGLLPTQNLLNFVY